MLFPVRPHQLLPTVRRKSPHQNLRKHLLRRKNSDASRSRQTEKPAKKRYREDDFDFDDDDYDYIQPDKVKSTEKRVVSKKKKAGA